MANNLNNSASTDLALFFEGDIWSFILPFALPVVICLAYLEIDAFTRHFPSRRARLLLAAVFGLFFGTVTGIIFAGPIIGSVGGLMTMGLFFFSGQGDGKGGRLTSSGNSRGDSRSSGGSFSGKGGSFGGGGASGKW